MYIKKKADLEAHNARLPIMNIIEPCSHELIRIELFRHCTANKGPFRYKSSRARFGFAVGMEGGHGGERFRRHGNATKEPDAEHKTSHTKC